MEWRWLADRFYGDHAGVVRANNVRHETLRRE